MAEKIRVLYVDDEPGLLDIGKVFLEQFGDFTVTTAISAPEALRLLEQEQFDTIISDYMMPGMDGIQFLIEVRKRFGAVPFILFTGKGREEVVIQALNSGADFYLQKGGEPISQFAELSHKVRIAVERLTTSEAFKVSETRLRTLIENASDIIRILDRDGLIVFDTSASEHLLGYPTGFTIGKSPMEFIHPDDLEMVKRELSQVYDNTNTGVPTEFRLRRADGSYTWVESVGKNLTGVPGIDGIVITTRFIDERKKGEASLRKSEERYRRIVETSREGIWAMDDKLVTTYVNECLIGMLGYTAEEMIGKQIQSFMATEELDDNRSQMEQRKVGKSGSYERRFRAKDGSFRTMYVSATPIIGEEGSFQGSFAMLTDITERKVTLAALTENEERLRTTLEILPVGVFIFSKTGQILMANAMVNRIWGVIEGVVPHSSGVEEFIEYKGWWPDTGVALMPEDWAASRVLMKGEAAPVDIVNIQRFDGSLGTIIVSAVPIHDDRGNLNGAVAVIQDITERKQAEEVLAESEDRFRGIFDTINSGVAIYEVRNNGSSGRDYIIKDFNKTALEIEGKTKEEVVGKSLFDLRPTIDEYGLIPVFQQVWATGVPAYFPQKIYIDEKYSSWYESWMFRLQSGEIVAVYDDVTERKRAEDVLKTLTTHLLHVQKIAHVGSFDFNIQENRVIWSDEMFRVFGHEPQASPFTIEQVREMIHPEDRELQREQTEKILETGSYEFEHRLIRPDGDIRWIAGRAEMVEYDAAGAPVRMLGTMQDITERKQSEEALSESEQKYREIFEKSVTGIFKTTHDGLLVDVNDTFARIYDYSSAAEMLADSKAGRHDYIRRHLYANPEDQKEINQILAEKGKIENYETRHIKRDGTHLWVSITARTIRNKDDTVIFYEGSVIDITERKLVEVALQESEEKYRSLSILMRLMCDNVPDMIWAKDLEKRYIYVNRAICSGLLNAIDTDEPVGKLDMFFAERERTRHADDPDWHTFGEICRDTDQITMDAGTPQQFDEYGNVQGKFLFLDVRKAPFIDEQGTMIGTVGSARDITERKRDEEILRESEGILQDIIEKNPMSIQIVDREGFTLRVNPAFIRLFGSVPPPDFSIITDLVKSYPELENHISRVKSGEPVNLPDMSFNPHDIYPELPDVPTRVRAIIFPLNDRHGKPQRFVFMHEDITEQRRAEEALRQANRKLNLLSGITRHDINNQLLVLNGFLKLLQNKATDPAYEDFFTRIKKASSQISSMIQFTKEYEQIGVNAPAWQGCHTLVETAAMEIQLGEISLVNDLPSGSEVFADPMIVKVFYNLMDNAVRYGGKITTIRFSVEEAGDDQVIVCEDDGIGVPVEEKEKIFERGFGKNTGLGLFLSREILAITGITIRETGEPGKGARFEMTVPKGMWRMNPGTNNISRSDP